MTCCELQLVTGLSAAGVSYLYDGLYCSHDHYKDPYHHDNQRYHLVARAPTGLREFQVTGSWDDEG